METQASDSAESYAPAARPGGRRPGMPGTPEYTCWVSMIFRCERSYAPNFKWYGARGIKVCERWRKSPQAFVADMGPRPSPAHSIDRIDNNGNYEPGNCRWATRKEQGRNVRSNRMVTAFGKTACIAEWAEHTGLSPMLIAVRLFRGWSDERAVSEPVNVQAASRKAVRS